MFENRPHTFQEEQLKLENEIAITKFKIEQLTNVDKIFKVSSLLNLIVPTSKKTDENSSLFEQGMQIFTSLKNLISSISQIRSSNKS
jgi:hypothetical protein